VLLRPGRGVYGLFVRDALLAAGFNDMPPNGGYVLGLIGSGGLPLSDVIAPIWAYQSRPPVNWWTPWSSAVTWSERRIPGTGGVCFSRSPTAETPRRTL
jgi:hypothetical protein